MMNDKRKEMRYICVHIGTRHSRRRGENDGEGWHSRV